MSLPILTGIVRGNYRDQGNTNPEALEVDLVAIHDDLTFAEPLPITDATWGELCARYGIERREPPAPRWLQAS